MDLVLSKLGRIARVDAEFLWHGRFIVPPRPAGRGLYLSLIGTMSRVGARSPLESSCHSSKRSGWFGKVPRHVSDPGSETVHRPRYWKSHRMNGSGTDEINTASRRLAVHLAGVPTTHPLRALPEQTRPLLVPVTLSRRRDEAWREGCPRDNNLHLSVGGLPPQAHAPALPCPGLRSCRAVPPTRAAFFA